MKGLLTFIIYCKLKIFITIKNINLINYDRYILLKYLPEILLKIILFLKYNHSLLIPWYTRIIKHFIQTLYQV